MTDEQYRKFWTGGVYLHEHMGDAPVLILPCLQLTEHELPSSIPPDVRAAMRLTAQWVAGASIYPAVQNIILAAVDWAWEQFLPQVTCCSRLRSKARSTFQKTFELSV
jgi:hypothetical protein